MVIRHRSGTCPLCGTFQKRFDSHHVRCREATPEQREHYLLTGGRWPKGVKRAGSCGALIRRLLRDHPEGLAFEELKRLVCESFTESTFTQHWNRTRNAFAHPLGDGRWASGRLLNKPNAPVVSGVSVFFVGKREHRDLLRDASREPLPLQPISSSEATTSLLDEERCIEVDVRPGDLHFFCGRRQENLPVAKCLEGHTDAHALIAKDSPCYGCVDGWRRRLAFANDVDPLAADVDGAISEWLVSVGHRVAAWTQWAEMRDEGAHQPRPGRIMRT